MTKYIPYGKHSVTTADIEAVAETLRSDWLTTGPKVDEFEQKIVEITGAKHAIAVNNATSALHLAMLVARIGPGDRVVTSSNTFLASANCAAYVGATPDFCDIDLVSYCLCPNKLEQTWQPDTKAVVAVDYAGQTANMPEIARIARDRGAIVIEDAAHAIGGRFEHEDQIFNIGGHPWADMTVFSFHPVKIVTSGEGGMLVTDNDEFARRARELRTHGMIRDPDRLLGLGAEGLNEFGPWYYEMQELGHNFRITDFQCALAISQLKRLNEYMVRRREIIECYNDAFAELPFVTIPGLRNPADQELTSWHLYTLMIDFEHLGVSRAEVMNQLKARGVGSQVLYIPVHLQPWYRLKFGYAVGKCPNAESYYRNALSMPLFASLDDRDTEFVIKETLEVLSRAEAE